MGSGKSNVAQPSKVKVHKKVSFDTKSYRFNFARKSTFARQKTRQQIGRMKCMVLNLDKVNVSGYEMPSNPALEPASVCARLLPVEDVLCCSRTTPVKQKYLKNSARASASSDNIASSMSASTLDDCSTKHQSALVSSPPVISNPVIEIEVVERTHSETGDGKGARKTALKDVGKAKAKKRKARPILLIQESSEKKIKTSDKKKSSKMKSRKKKRRLHSKEGVTGDHFLSVTPTTFQSTSRSPDEIEYALKLSETIDKITSKPVEEKKRLI